MQLQLLKKIAVIKKDAIAQLLKKDVIAQLLKKMWLHSYMIVSMLIPST